MQSILGICGGIISGLAIWFLGTMVFTSLYPYPNSLDLADKLALQEFYNSLPRYAYVVKIIIHVFTIFTSGLIASIIAKHLRFQSGIFAVLPFLIYFIVSDFKFDFPTLYVVSNISLISIVAFASILYGGTRVFS